MKKCISICLSSLLIVMLFSGCITLSQENNKNYPPVGAENEDLAGIITVESRNHIQLSLENKTDEIITVVVDLANFTNNISGYNSRLIESNTKSVDASRSQPPIIIAPGGVITKIFTAADAINYTSDGWKISNWVPENYSATTYIFGYKVSGQEKYLIFDTKSIEDVLIAETKIDVLGQVYIEKKNWNVFFLRPVEKRRNELYEKALDKAREQYGDNIVLSNVRYKGSWSPASLLLYFSMFGFVEKASITADIIAK
jgi:hypothetical protein